MKGRNWGRLNSMGRIKLLLLKCSICIEYDHSFPQHPVLHWRILLIIYVIQMLLSDHNALAWLGVSLDVFVDQLNKLVIKFYLFIDKLSVFIRVWLALVNLILPCHTTLSKNLE